MNKHVTMVSPTSGRAQGFPASSVPYWESRGWVRAATVGDPPVDGDPEPDLATVDDPDGEFDADAGGGD